MRAPRCRNWCAERASAASSRSNAKIDRTTVWRACRRIGLPTRQRPHKREGDTRRWRYAERMQCVLADGKHFRAGAARLRRVALFFLDDATRYGLEVLVGTAESSELFLRALYQMVMRYGLADLLFLDYPEEKTNAEVFG